MVYKYSTLANYLADIYCGLLGVLQTLSERWIIVVREEKNVLSINVILLCFI